MGKIKFKSINMRVPVTQKVVSLVICQTNLFKIFSLLNRYENLLKIHRATEWRKKNFIPSFNLATFLWPHLRWRLFWRHFLIQIVAKRYIWVNYFLLINETRSKNFAYFCYRDQKFILRQIIIICVELIFF